jgi:hypothetical protein
MQLGADEGVDQIAWDPCCRFGEVLQAESVGSHQVALSVYQGRGASGWQMADGMADGN